VWESVPALPFANYLRNGAFDIVPAYSCSNTLLLRSVIANAVQTDASRSASARSFLHSLNILVKYTRLYGVTHKRTEGQFETTWKELQEALPKSNDTAFCSASPTTSFFSMAFRSKPDAERSFAQLLNAPGSPASCFPQSHA